MIETDLAVILGATIGAMIRQGQAPDEIRMQVETVLTSLAHQADVTG